MGPLSNVAGIAGKSASAGSGNFFSAFGNSLKGMFGGSQAPAGQEMNQAIGGGLQGAFETFTTVSNVNQNKGLTDGQKGIARTQGIVNGVTNGLLKSGNPIAMGVGAGLKILDFGGGLLMKNNSTSKAAKDFKLNDDVASSSGYTGVASNAMDAKATGDSYTKSGMFGKLFSNAGKIKSDISSSTGQQNQTAQILKSGRQALNDANSSAGMVADRNRYKLYNTDMWNNGSIQFGQQGMKIVAPQDNTLVVTQKMHPTVQNHPGTPIKNREGFDSNWVGRYIVGDRINDGEHKTWPEAFETSGSLSDLYNYYSGQPLKNKVLSISSTKPSNSSSDDTEYISINDPQFRQQVVDNYNRVSTGHLVKSQRHRLNEVKIRDNTYNVSAYKDPVGGTLGHYTVSKGHDEKGDYISYYDTFDMSPGNRPSIFEKLNILKPFEVYDRIYLDANGKPKDYPKESLPAKLAKLVKHQQGGKFAPGQGQPQAQPKAIGGQPQGQGQTITPEQAEKMKINQGADQAQAEVKLNAIMDGYVPPDTRKRIAKPAQADDKVKLAYSIKSKLHNNANTNNVSNWSTDISGLITNALTRKVVTVEDPTIPIPIQGKVPIHKDGGAINVIVDGKLHAHKHDIKNLPDFEDVNITAKGVPVVTKEDGGEIRQHAEVEKNELILHHGLTKALEALAKEGTEEAMIEAGKLLAKEIVKNTKDSKDKVLKNA